MALPAGVKVVDGGLDASGLSVAIVVARFNAFVTERLLEGAVDALVRHGARPADLTVVRVPGAYELPLTVQRVAERGGVDAIVALGCLIRGDTIHFELIAGAATKGLSVVAMQASVPVSFGILTTDSLEQAVHRAGAKAGNKGSEAAMAAVEQVSVLRALDRSVPAPAGHVATKKTKKTKTKTKTKKKTAERVR